MINNYDVPCRVKLATASACVFDIVVGLKTLFKTMMDNFSAIDAASWQLLILHINDFML